MKWAAVISLGLVAAAGLMACAGLRRPGHARLPEVPGVTSRAFGPVRVHALLTGWVRVKRAHRDLTGPVATRMLSIIADREWTPWMPVMSYAVEHPEGVFLVDTGLTQDMLNEEHFACDPGTSFVYRNLVQFDFKPSDRLDLRLAEAGLTVERVRGVVLTHRHADHTDGLRLVPGTAEVFVGSGDWPAHAGALVCRWPTARTPTLVDAERDLTTDGALRIVPLKGHSPGHLGVELLTEHGAVLFAGDAVFDLAQLRDRRIAGISEVPGDALLSLERIAQRLAQRPTFLLPAHDPEAIWRFERGETTAAP